MSNNMLIKAKDGIIQKVISFLKKLFFRKEYKEIKNTESIINLETNENKMNLQKEETSIQNEMSKKDFLDLYERAKNREVNLMSLDVETLKKLCKLIEEEIKIIDKATLDTKQKIKEIEVKLNYNN